jgi:hypothetical protein
LAGWHADTGGKAFPVSSQIVGDTLSNFRLVATVKLEGEILEKEIVVFGPTKTVNIIISQLITRGSRCN